MNSENIKTKREIYYEYIELIDLNYKCHLVSVDSDNYNFMQVGAMQGWQCPICKRVLAPFVQECPCKGQGMETLTIATAKEEQ